MAIWIGVLAAYFIALSTTLAIASWISLSLPMIGVERAVECRLQQPPRIDDLLPQRAQ